MAITIEEAAAYLSRYDSEFYTPQCREAHLAAIEALQNEESRRWIPVAERMPEEHDSIFARMYGTNKWHTGMFRAVSDEVVVCLKYEDGEMAVKSMKTRDGNWDKFSTMRAKVTHWMPLPEPPKEGA